MKIIAPALFALLLFACRSETPLPDSLEVNEIDLPNLSIRALNAVDDNSCWFSGSNGSFGYTRDGGLLWSIDSIPEAKGMELRSLAVLNDSTAFVLSAGSPALLFKTPNYGEKWTLVFEDRSEEVFFDSMKFWDNLQGIAFGDPNNGCFHILITRDGGNSWNRVPCDNLPIYVEGEGAFAASNTNIKCFGSHVWIITGSNSSRILHSQDYGRTWEIFETPIIQSSEMSGGFGMDMYDDKKGIVIGGDWENPESKEDNLIRTSDGGKNWSIVNHESRPGFQSCVQYIPGKGSDWLVSVGYPGLHMSNDGGTSWRAYEDQKLWFAVEMSPSGKRGFLSGHKKLGVFSLIE